jgi:hypothetical protein
MDRAVNAPLPRVDVPCGKCQLCCKIHFVFLNEREYDQYEWGWCMRTGDDGKQHAIGRVLNRKSNGDCVYLDEYGCTIHDRAPKVCREFDCRTLFLRSDRNGRRLAVKNGEIKRELFDKGREMVKLAEVQGMQEFKPMPQQPPKALPDVGFSMTPVSELCPQCGMVQPAKCDEPTCPYRQHPAWEKQDAAPTTPGS